MRFSFNGHEILDGIGRVTYVVGDLSRRVSATIRHPSSVSSRLREANSGVGRWLCIRTPILVTLLSIAAASLRFFRLAEKSFTPDESFSIIFAGTRWNEFVHLLLTSESNMGLYYVLLRYWSRISDTPYFVRTLSVASGVVAVVAVYFAGKALFSSKAGIIAATLLAVNTFHAEYSMQARSYSLLVLLVTCSSVFFVRNVQSQGREGGGWYILSSAAALYAHFFAALVILAQFVSWILLPAEYRKWAQLRQMTAVAVLGSPLFLFVLFHTGTHLDWIERPTPKEIYHFFALFSGNGVRLIIFLMAVGFALREFLRRKTCYHPMQAWPFVFTTTWWLLPILVTAAASYWKPIFVPRFLIICLVPALLLYGEGLTLVSSKKLQHAALLVVICGSLIAMRSFYRTPDSSDWRSAITFLAGNARSGDVLVFANPYCGYPFAYNLRTLGLQFPDVQMQSGDSGTIPKLTGAAGRVWVIDFGSEGRTLSPGPAMRSGHFDSVVGFALRRKLVFPGVEVYEFVRTEQQSVF